MAGKTTYSQDTVDKICEAIALGSSLRTVLKQDGMPAMPTVFKWMRENEIFSKQYARACEERTEAMAEDLLDIADDGHNDWMEVYDKKDNAIGWRINGEAVTRSKLRADTRKWIMARMKPKKYGDKLDLSSSDGSMTPTVIIEGVYANKPNFRTDTPAPQADELAADSREPSGEI